MPEFWKFNRELARRRSGTRNVAACAGLVLALGLVWQGATGALAASPAVAPDASAHPINPTATVRLDLSAADASPQRQDLGPSVAAALARLVSAGTISQTQSDAIWRAQLGQSALDLRALVAGGVINDTQAAAVGTILDQVKREVRPNGTQAPDVALPTKPVAPTSTLAPEGPLPTKPIAPSTTPAPNLPAPTKP
jgi:hypothetical protein